jgi:hypothetical protein
VQMFEGTVPMLEDLVPEDGGCSYCGGSLRLHEDAVLLHIIPSGEWRCVADMRVHRCEGWFDREHSGPREATRIRPLPRGCRPTRPSSPRKTYYSPIHLHKTLDDISHLIIHLCSYNPYVPTCYIHLIIIYNNFPTEKGLKP